MNNIMNKLSSTISSTILTSNSIVLNNFDIKKIRYLVNAMVSSNTCPLETPMQFCANSKGLSNFLPKRIKSALLDFQNNTSKTGCILISNVPLLESETDNVDGLIRNPHNLYRIQSLFVNAIPYTEMLAYEAEGGGRLFQNIFPRRTMANEQTSLSSTELEIHTEQAFSKMRPDILSLACLRGDVDALTYILPVNTILANLSDSECALLRAPLWNFGVDLSFKMNCCDFIDGYKRGPLPIITGSLDDPLLRFDQDLITGITEPAKDIVAKIIDIYYKHRTEFNLKPGDIILIDNNRAVHGRSSFSPKYDGKDRFLSRCFAMYHYRYERSAYAIVPNTRMISSRYS